MKWPMNGALHIAIREPQCVRRLSRSFSRSFSAVDLAEPLLSLDEDQPASAAMELMRARRIPVLGVRRAGQISGWVGEPDLTAGTLGECARDFTDSVVLDEDAGFEAIMAALPAAGHVFVLWLGEVAAVITDRDLQKAPLRMWLFGAITIFDTNLTWAIAKVHPDGTWQEMISPGRLAKAVSLHAERRRRGTDCELIDCLQIKDKTDILTRDGENLAALGIASRSEAERVTRALETLRNHLAHAQELEQRDLEVAARLASLIRVILQGEGARRVVESNQAKSARTTKPPAP